MNLLKLEIEIHQQLNCNIIQPLTWQNSLVISPSSSVRVIIDSDSQHHQ